MNGLVVRCQDHPTYRGLRKPRVDCEECEYVHKMRGAQFFREEKDWPEHTKARVGSA